MRVALTVAWILLPFSFLVCFKRLLGMSYFPLLWLWGTTCLCLQKEGVGWMGDPSAYPPPILCIWLILKGDGSWRKGRKYFRGKQRKGESPHWSLDIVGDQETQGPETQKTHKNQQSPSGLSPSTRRILYIRHYTLWSFKSSGKGLLIPWMDRAVTFKSCFSF